MTRRGWAWVVALVVVQAAAIIAWRLVEAGRVPAAPFLSESVRGTLPPLRVERVDGTQAAVTGSAGALLLHFWASWCGPCRDELPALLALEIEGLTVVAVAVDDTWPALRQLVPEPPARVVRALDGDVVRALGVVELPVTLFVAPGGILRERYQGVRAWGGAAARAHLEALVEGSR